MMEIQANRVGRAGILCTLTLCVAACGGSAEDVRDDNTEAVNQLLTDGLAFEGGTVVIAALPPTTSPEVQIEALETTVIVSPSATRVMSLTVRSSIEDTDPIIATVVRFGDSPQHISVARRTAVTADIENSFTVDADICETLCKRTYTVTAVEAGQTASGEVGAHSERSITLDCTDAGVPECSGEDPGATSEQPVDGSPGTATWTAMLLAEIRRTASEGWQQTQACDIAPEQNALADSAAVDLAQIGVASYSSDDYQSLGPDPIAGTWQSITFSAGEESMTAAAARNYGTEVTVGVCGSTSLGVHIQPQGGRFVAALVWLQCIECGDVCATPTSPSCQAAGAMP